MITPTDADICCGRGNAVNFRKGNRDFRQLAREKAVAYAEAPVKDKTTKDDIAESILTEIKSRGGRFLKCVSIRRGNGEVSSAWEVVDHETSLAKVKQTLRDCVTAIRKEANDRAQTTSMRTEGAFADHALSSDASQGVHPRLNQLLQNLPGYWSLMLASNGNQLNLQSHSQTQAQHAQTTTFPSRIEGIMGQPSPMGQIHAPERYRIGRIEQESDRSLLEKYQKLQEESILRRRYLLSQLSDEALRQFLVSEQMSGLVGRHQSFDNGLHQQQSFVHRGMPGPSIETSTTGRAMAQVIPAVQGTSDRTSEAGSERTTGNEKEEVPSESESCVKPPPKKRHRLYEPPDTNR